VTCFANKTWLNKPLYVYGPTWQKVFPAPSWYCSVSQCRTIVLLSSSSRDVLWTRTPRYPAWTRRETWVLPDWNTENYGTCKCSLPIINYMGNLSKNFEIFKKSSNCFNIDLFQTGKKRVLKVYEEKKTSYCM